MTPMAHLFLGTLQNEEIKTVCFFKESAILMLKGKMSITVKFEQYCD